MLWDVCVYEDPNSFPELSIFPQLICSLEKNPYNSLNISIAAVAFILYLSSLEYLFPHICCFVCGDLY